MGLYKICEHKGRARDRCDHGWWGSFRGTRVSLEKWVNRDIKTKAEADKALDDLRAAIRAGTFDERGLEAPIETSPLTFSEFADVYKQRHVLAKGLALADTIDYRLKPLIERFGDRLLADIKTADIEDFVADLKKLRIVNSIDRRTLTAASINRALGLLRHMLNWAVGREYLDRTPFRRGTEVLVRLEREDNKRRRRVSEEEEAALLAVASPQLRSMIIAALDTGMRRGEMLALRFGDVDWKRRVIVLRGETTKSRRTRVVPIGTSRLLAVLEWLRLDSTGDHSDGPSRSCVLGALSIVVSSLSRGDVLSVTNIQRVVSTAQDVCECHSTTMPSSSLTDHDDALGLTPSVLRCANVQPSAGRWLTEDIRPVRWPAESGRKASRMVPLGGCAICGDAENIEFVGVAA
jgi:integrase